MSATKAPQLSRYELEKRRMIAEQLQRYPQLVPEAVARHYLSVATLAQNLYSALSGVRCGAPGSGEMAVRLLDEIERRHVDDFGREAIWRTPIA